MRMTSSAQVRLHSCIVIKMFSRNHSDGMRENKEGNVTRMTPTKLKIIMVLNNNLLVKSSEFLAGHSHPFFPSFTSSTGITPDDGTVELLPL